jgi:hypothetical protein
MSRYGTDEWYADIRRIACKWLLLHRAEFPGVFFQEEFDKSLLAYVVDVLRDRTWGDQLILYAFGRALRVSVRLILHGRVHTPRSDHQEEADDDLHVVFVRRNHYDAVVESGQTVFANADELDDVEADLDNELNEAGIVIADHDGVYDITGLEEHDDSDDDEKYVEFLLPHAFFVCK